MKCPYCQNEMQEGFLRTSGLRMPYWQNEGADGKAAGVLTDNSSLPFYDEVGGVKIKAAYCGQCHKIIIDTDIGR